MCVRALALCLLCIFLQERGWNAVEFNDVYDCWARDIHTVNADNGVVMTGGCCCWGSNGAAGVPEARVPCLPLH
jgi:hypothetical protein